jgi:hypothetical protein
MLTGGITFCYIRFCEKNDIENRGQFLYDTEDSPQWGCENRTFVVARVCMLLTEDLPCIIPSCRSKAVVGDDFEKTYCCDRELKQSSLWEESGSSN